MGLGAILDNFLKFCSPWSAALLALPCAAAPLSLEGLSPEAAGHAVFAELDRRQSGYEDLVVDLTMVLRTASGRESRRALSIRQLEVPDDGDKLLVVFESPPPIRGMALLSHSHKARPDDQWLFLPAMNRVKRIASHNRSGPFLGSEFAYEDLALEEVEKFDYRLLEQTSADAAGLDAVAEGPMYVVERIPLDPNSGYARQQVWLDAAELRVYRIDYEDRYDRELKTLHVDGYKRHLDRYWKAAAMRMANHQTGKSTDLFWQDYRFAVGLDGERDFSTSSLRRVR